MIEIPRIILTSLMYIFPVFWISGSVWVYIDAKRATKKEREIPAILWFFICLLFCPITIFIYLFIRKPKNHLTKVVVISFIIFGLFWFFQIGNVGDMKRYGRVSDEIDRETSKLNIGVSKKEVIESFGKPEYRSKIIPNGRINQIEVLEYKVYKGILTLVFQSDTLIDKYYLEF